MNFAAVFRASLRSGYALPTCHPENSTPQRQPAEAPLIQSRNPSRQSRPALLTADSAGGHSSDVADIRYRPNGLNQSMPGVDIIDRDRSSIIWRLIHCI